jgi:hypothetical protein
MARRPCVLGSTLAREQAVTDQTLPHVCSDNDKDYPDDFKLIRLH